MASSRARRRIHRPVPSPISDLQQPPAGVDTYVRAPVESAQAPVHSVPFEPAPVSGDAPSAAGAQLGQGAVLSGPDQPPIHEGARELSGQNYFEHILPEMSPPPVNPRNQNTRGTAAPLGDPVYRSVPRPATDGSGPSAGPARTSSAPGVGKPVDADVPALPLEPVCPFCGLVNEFAGSPCQRCTMEDTAVTREATHAKLGGWFVYQARNPAAPGMNYVTLLALIERGRITRRSIVRGPTTGQFWRYASRVKGISREFGLCWNCGGELRSTARLCPRCKHLQEPPINPDVMLEGEPLLSPPHPGEPRKIASPAPTVGLLSLSELPAAHSAHEAKPSAAASLAGTGHPLLTPPDAAARAPRRVPPGLIAGGLPRPAPPPAQNGRPTPPRERPIPLGLLSEEIETSRASTLPVIDMGELDDQTLASGRELAAFNLPADYAVGARPRQSLKGVALTAVLVAFAFASLVYLNPSLGHKYLAWGKSVVDNLSAAGKPPPAIAPPSTPIQPYYAPRPPEQSVRTAPPASSPSVSLVPVPATQVTKASPATNPAVIPNALLTPLTNTPLTVNPALVKAAVPGDGARVPPRVAPPTPSNAVPPHGSPVQDVTIAHVPPPQTVPETHVAPPPPEPMSAEDRAMELWRTAIAAERKGDYPQAVKLYESIKLLPENARPMSLEISLQRAQRELRKASVGGEK